MSKQAKAEPFREPRPNDKFMLQDTGEIVTYGELLSRTGEHPTTKAELEALLVETSAAALVTGD